MTFRLRAALLAALAMPAAASADHGFILPSSTLLAGDNNVVTFDAAGSDHLFFFDRRPLPLDAITVWKPDGSTATITNTLQGRFRSVFDLKVDRQGTWKIASQQVAITGSFKQNGEERRVAPPRPAAPAAAGTPPTPPAPPPGGGEPRRLPPVAFADIPADATDVHLVETVGRIETFVTAGAPTTAVFKPSGRGLELDPITHPNAAVQGETARFRFLIDGRPAPGAKVTVVPGGDRYRDDSGTMNLVTGTDGVVAITWPTAGMYWVGAEAEDQHPAEKKAETRRMAYAATIEVMTP